MGKEMIEEKRGESVGEGLGVYISVTASPHPHPVVSVARSFFSQNPFSTNRVKATGRSKLTKGKIRAI